MDIKWENPPEKAQTQYAEIAAALKTRPGDWAVVKEYTEDPTRKTTPRARASAQRAAWRQGTAMTAFTKGEYEVVARAGKVYARYVGANA